VNNTLNYEPPRSKAPGQGEPDQRLRRLRLGLDIAAISFGSLPIIGLISLFAFEVIPLGYSACKFGMWIAWLVLSFRLFTFNIQGRLVWLSLAVSTLNLCIAYLVTHLPVC